MGVVVPLVELSIAPESRFMIIVIKLVSAGDEVNEDMVISVIVP